MSQDEPIPEPLSALVRAADNGWVVVGPDPNHDGTLTTVYEYDDDPVHRVEAFERVLWDLVRRFDMVGTKHDAARVRVGVEARKP